MDQSTTQPSREQQMYWSEFNQLRVDACYVREYGNSIGKWVTAFAVLRKFTSASGIGAWLIWRKYAFLWAFLIAAAQVTEVVEGAIPFYKRRTALSKWSRSLNRLFVEAQQNRDEISSGQCTNAQIRKLSHQLRSRKERVEAKYIPNGFRRR